MKEELLELLCEPDTGADLELTVTEARHEEIWEGSLRSALTGKEYLIRSGIPRFVPHEDYSESFGLQWTRFAKVQLDSANGARYSHRRFEAEVGWSKEQVEGQWLLDGGCGCGRFAEVAAELGAKVIALDYSSAVDAAASNLRRHPNVYYVQGDLLHPPIRPRSIGFAYSIGVLQHTPDAPAAMASLLDLLAPGGEFRITAYGRHWYTRLYSKYLVRPLTRRMPPKRLLRVIEASMPILFPLTNVLYSAPVIGRLAAFVIPVANYVDKTDFAREQRYQEAVLDTFDMLSPAFDRPMTAGEVRRVFQRMGIQDFSFRSTTPINVAGSVPHGVAVAGQETPAPRQPEQVGA
jgi:SAM-dependent methyltransferase